VFGFVQTPGEATDRVNGLIEGLWVLAAVARLMRSNDELDAQVEHVLVESGLASRSSDGDLVLAPGLADLRVQRGDAFGESIESAMGQAVGAAKRSAAGSGWDADDDTLVAQGRASAAAGRLLATAVASQLAGLSERLAQPGARLKERASPSLRAQSPRRCHPCMYWALTSSIERSVSQTARSPSTGSSIVCECGARVWRTSRSPGPLSWSGFP
jgi:hypothetical protein